MNKIEFYQLIEARLRQYLPLGYQEYAIHINEVTFSERKYALLLLEKEGIKNMPVMSLEPYLDRVESGSNETAVLIDIAVDYIKMISIFCKNNQRVPESNQPIRDIAR